MHHENSHVPREVQRGERRKRKREKCMHEKGSRVTDTICLVVENAGSTWSPYFRLISVMRNTNPRVIKMPGAAGGCCPCTTMSRLLIEIMSSVHISSFPTLFHYAQSNGLFALHSTVRITNSTLEFCK